MIRCVILMQDLVKCTPTSHADYDLLQKTLSSAQHFIENFDGTYKDSVSYNSVLCYFYSAETSKYSVKISKMPD